MNQIGLNYQLVKSWLTYRYYSPGVRFHGVITKELANSYQWYICQMVNKERWNDLEINEESIVLYDSNKIIGAATLNLDDEIAKAVNQSIRIDSETDPVNFCEKYLFGKFECNGIQNGSFQFAHNKCDVFFSVARRVESESIRCGYDFVKLNGGRDGFLDISLRKRYGEV